MAASEETGAWLRDAMPLFDAQGRLGLNLDRWVTIQSAQNHEIPGGCYTSEKEWRGCAPGIRGPRAEKEFETEFDDFVECLLRQKTMECLSDVRRQQDKLIKEEKYASPPPHVGSQTRSRAAADGWRLIFLFSLLPRKVQLLKTSL